jgi:hypothetical protein
VPVRRATSPAAPRRAAPAFLSAVHHDPDVSVELFVLDGTAPLPR